MGCACKSVYLHLSPVQRFQKAQEVWILPFHRVEPYTLLWLSLVLLVWTTVIGRENCSSCGPGTCSRHLGSHLPVWGTATPLRGTQMALLRGSVLACKACWTSVPESGPYWSHCRCHRYWPFLSETLDRSMTTSFWEVVFEVVCYKMVTCS